VVETLIDLKEKQTLDSTLAAMDAAFNDGLAEPASTKSHDTKVVQMQPFYKRAAFRVAAMIVILLIPAAIYFSQLNSDSDLFADNFESYSLRIKGDVRGATENELQLFTSKYKKQDYEGALIGLKTILNDEPDHPVFNFYVGMCHLELLQTESAIKAFLITIEDGQSAFVEQAIWYLALGYLKNEELAKAKNQLQLLKESPANYKEKEATNLLEKMQ
jgi:hypothetical protein